MCSDQNLRPGLIANLGLKFFALHASPNQRSVVNSVAISAQ
jgi:hypothetical protein